MLAWLVDALSAFYAGCVVFLTFYGLHMGLLLVLAHLRPVSPRRVSGNAEGYGTGSFAWPRVTVQLPLFDELHVVERLLDAVAVLDYPRDRLEVQVLCDSTDETATVAAARVAHWRARGLDATYRHRGHRTGFKAGALAEGLATAKGELIAVFDADFVPSPDFLRRVIGERAAFADPDVGFAQARWSFLNRDENRVTAALSVLLDVHFLFEQTARSRHGLLFTFNGSGGIWRRACIDDAGGWQGDTLTEDLDLSYRAQLRGWRGVFLPEVLTPSELPTNTVAFKQQQARWSRGSLQCARELVPQVARARIGAGRKLAAFFHLTSYLMSLAFLALLVLLPPLTLFAHWDGRPHLPPLTLLAHWDGRPHLPAWLGFVGPVGLVFLVALCLAQLRQRRGGGLEGVLAALAGRPFVLMLSTSVCLSNALAALRGLCGRHAGVFERTPKESRALADLARACPGPGVPACPGPGVPACPGPGVPACPSASGHPPAAYRQRPRWTLAGEALLVLYLVAAVVLLALHGDVFPAVLTSFYALSFVYLGASQWAYARRGLERS